MSHLYALLLFFQLTSTSLCFQKYTSKQKCTCRCFFNYVGSFIFTLRAVDFSLCVAWKLDLTQPVRAKTTSRCSRVNKARSTQEECHVDTGPVRTTDRSVLTCEWDHGRRLSCGRVPYPCSNLAVQVEEEAKKGFND